MDDKMTNIPNDIKQMLTLIYRFKLFVEKFIHPQVWTNQSKNNKSISYKSMIERACYLTLGTSEIYSPMSPLSVKK